MGVILRVVKSEKRSLIINHSSSQFAFALFNIPANAVKLFILFCIIASFNGYRGTRKLEPNVSTEICLTSGQP